MPEYLTHIIEVLVPGVLLSVLTAIVTVRLSLRRFYAEKWWERKDEAYCRIFEALYWLMNYYNVKYQEDIEKRRVSGDRSKQLEKQFLSADMEIEKAVAVGSFVLCDEAIACLKRFRDRPRLSFDDYEIFEMAERDMKYLDECLSELKKIAKRDLKLKLS